MSENVIPSWLCGQVHSKGTSLVAEEGPRATLLRKADVFLRNLDLFYRAKKTCTFPAQFSCHRLKITSII